MVTLVLSMTGLYESFGEMLLLSPQGLLMRWKSAIPSLLSLAVSRRTFLYKFKEVTCFILLHLGWLYQVKSDSAEGPCVPRPLMSLRVSHLWVWMQRHLYGIMLRNIEVLYIACAKHCCDTNFYHKAKSAQHWAWDNRREQVSFIAPGFR